MTIARLYTMTAIKGKGGELRTVLLALGEVVLRINGCLGVELVQSTTDETRFHFIEKWSSQDAHKEGQLNFPKEAMTPLKGLLAQPPVADYCNYFSL